MICPHCQDEISLDRQEAIRDFDLPVSCTSCSKVQAPIVLMNYDHKTAGAPMVIPQNPDGTNNSESIRKAISCFKRKR